MPPTSKAPSLFKLLESLLLCSEKAATIARLTKLEYNSFLSLVQQKSGTEANPRFNVDVKTLADILIQEVIRFDLEKLYPGFGSFIYGEETNQFRNEAKNETHIVRVTDSTEEVFSLLCEIFGESTPLASKLAEVATCSLDHFRNADALRDFHKQLDHTDLKQLKSISIQLSDYGLWIDPIDSTAEYVRCPSLAMGNVDGVTRVHSADHLPLLTKLSCHALQIPGQLVNVTVLLGLFDRVTGGLLLGVVNQPFYVSECEIPCKPDHPYSGRLFWGVNCTEPVVSSNCAPAPAPQPPSPNSHASLSTESFLQLPNRLFDCAQSVCRTTISHIGLRIACSYVEFKRFDSVFQNWSSESDASSKVTLISSPGAGFKLLCVIMDQLDAYLVWKPNTFWWDTCAPHAILRAINGGVIRLRPAIRLTQQLLNNSSKGDIQTNIKSILNSQLDDLEIRYRDRSIHDVKTDSSSYCNADGFMAYRRRDIAIEVLLHLGKNMPIQ